MTDYTELKRLVDRVLTDRRFCGDENHKALADGVVALIAENQAFKGPHDWLAEDLIKELVDNAQAFQENSDHGDNDPFAIVLLAAASRIRRQEASIAQLKAYNERLEGALEFKAIDVKTYRDAYQRFQTENEALRKALSECADSLHGEMLQKFAGQQPEDMHPVTRRDYDRDMAEVAGYRSALSKGEQP
ncbi:hypothetical protein WIN67_17765 [Pseudomonas idahonensis]|uniref:hypothetical protein n=1 Tax=Pseudomonas idahonensis TaxID=2942628 RepID=UPI0030CC27FF